MFSLPLLGLSLVSCVATTQSSVDIKRIDELAQKRDVDGLRAFTSGAAPLQILKTNGPYACGKFGWHAVGNRGYVVLTTPLTSEDVGDFLFRIRPDGKLEYIPETETLGVKFGKHSLTARFDLAKKQASLTDLVPVIGAPEGDYVFRLSPAYKVSSITANGAQVSFAQLGGVVILPKTATGNLLITYSGTVDLPLYAGSIDEKHIQLTNDYWYPMIARNPAAFTMKAKVPADWKAVGMGEWKTLAPGEFEFNMELPTTYWSFNAEAYKAVARKPLRGPEFRVWSSRLTPAEMEIQTYLYEPIFDFYQKFAPYPFSGYGAVDSPAYGGGALEAYSFATYGGGLPYSDAHEPAHTWFGGILDNTYLHSFWNESFAVFCEGFYAREGALGDREARRAVFEDQALDAPGYANVAIADGSVFSGPNASDLGYGKGSHVLAMLEQLIGPEAMTYALRTWIIEHPKGTPAEWEEFETIVKRLNPGLELQGYFDYWLRKPGVPKVEVSSIVWKDGALRGKVNPDVPKMPLEFVLVDAKGTFVRKTVYTNRIDKDGNFSIEGPTVRPAKVLFDPFHRALRKGAPAPATDFFSVTRGWRTYGKLPEGSKISLGRNKIEKLSADLDQMVLVGDPVKVPQMKPLLEKIGFSVEGDSLMWRGTRVDLKTAGAVAIVDLGEGKRCGVVLGTASIRPEIGRASLALFDKYGRFLTGVTPLPPVKEGVFEIR